MSGREYDNWEDNVPQEALEGGEQKLSDYASYELGNVEAVPSHVEARIVSGLSALEQRAEGLERGWRQTLMIDKGLQLDEAERWIETWMNSIAEEKALAEGEAWLTQ